MDIIKVLDSVNRGLKRARDEYNGRESVRSGQRPPHEYGIIVCGMRSFDTSSSKYFEEFLRVHHYETPQRQRSLASMALITVRMTYCMYTVAHVRQASLWARDELGTPVVALDIAGAENGFPAEEHKEAYSLAHKNFLNKTVHAGEGYGPESIFQVRVVCETQASL